MILINFYYKFIKLIGVVSPYDGSSEPNLFRNVEVDFKHNDVEVMTF